MGDEWRPLLCAIWQSFFLALMNLLNFAKEEPRTSQGERLPAYSL